MSEDTHDSHVDPAADAETIVTEGRDVRERVRDLAVDAIRNRKLGLDEIGTVAKDVLDGAAKGIDESVPADPTSTLRQVFDGLADSFSTAANATRLAVEEARGRGETLAKEDLERAADDLGKLEEMFFDTVSQAASRTTEVVGAELKAIVTHARRTGTSIRPSVTAALAEAQRHPVTLTKEAATAGVEVTRRSAGALMHAMSGLLAAAGDLLAGEKKDDGGGGENAG